MDNSSKLLKEQCMHDVALAYTLYNALREDKFLTAEDFVKDYEDNTVNMERLLNRTFD